MTEQIRNRMTIQEFRYWLEGVEEMQPDDWSPDSRQWARIREKLETISDSLPTPTLQLAHRTTDYPDQQSIPERYQGPMQFAAPGLGSGIAPPSTNTLFGNADNPDSPARTPNIDTSGGTYNPAFV